MRPIRLLAPLALLGLAACGGPLLSAEVVVDRFCLVQHVTGLPPILAAGTATTPPVSAPLQLPPLLRTSGSTAEVELLDGKLTPTTPGVTLDGIDRLDLLLGPGLAPAAHYVRATAGPVTSIPLSGAGVDVGGMIRSGSITMAFTVTASGPPPAVAWEADLELCFRGKTVVSYF